MRAKIICILFQTSNGKGLGYRPWMFATSGSSPGQNHQESMTKEQQVLFWYAESCINKT